MAMRLGFKVPETWLLPHKVPPANERFAPTAERYNQMFDLDAVGHAVGYPMYMKPFHGGGWVNVTRIGNSDELRMAYDRSGRELMHVQAGVEGYQAFARGLCIGPETMVMRYDPTRPLHERYAIAHDFLDPGAGEEILTFGRIIGAFFRWEFNSFEVIVRDGVSYPIDFANACPDMAIISLHYYFPWALKTLAKWSVYCAVTGRRMHLDFDPRRWYDVADDESLAWPDKLAAWRRLADDDTDADRYREFCAAHLANVDEVMTDYIESDEFDRLLVDTVRAAFPAAEHDRFVPHYRGLLADRAADERAAAR